MFCVNCGKQTAGSAVMCEQCSAYCGIVKPIAPIRGGSSERVGRAICGLVFGLIGAVLSLVILSLFLNMDKYPAESIAILFLAPFVVPCFIVSLVLGIKSMRCFGRASYKKPFATFFIGLVSVLCALEMNVIAVTVISQLHAFLSNSV